MLKGMLPAPSAVSSLQNDECMPLQLLSYETSRFRQICFPFSGQEGPQTPDARSPSAEGGEPENFQHAQSSELRSIKIHRAKNSPRGIYYNFTTCLND
jgi:hypothetical protein